MSFPNFNSLSIHQKLPLLGLAAYGAYKVAQTAWNNSKSLLQYFVLRRKNLASRYGQGSWAIVTGASDGLGKQYSTELAKEGFNIVLVARNKVKTEAVAAEITKAIGVKTCVLIFDFSKLETQEDVDRLNKQLDSVKELDISILVNNLGALIYGDLMRLDIASVNSHININVNAITYMTMALLPRLL